MSFDEEPEIMQEMPPEQPFYDWFNSNEIRGDYDKAFELLKENIKKEKNMNILFNAFFYH